MPACGTFPPFHLSEMSKLEKEKSSNHVHTPVDDGRQETIVEKDSWDRLEKPDFLRYDEVPWCVSDKMKRECSTQPSTQVYACAIRNY